MTVATALAGIGLAYFAKEQDFSLYTSWQLLAAALTFVAAFVCFLGAIVGWPFPPWAKLGFPNIRVDIYGAARADTVHEIAPDFKVPAHLWGYRIRITNLENEQNAGLTIRLYVKLVPGSHGRVGEAIGLPVNWAIDPSLRFDPLPETIGLPPGTTTSGDLVYEISPIDLGTLAEPRRVRLEIEDHTSGKRMGKVLEGDLARFTRGDMTPPTHRGVEILGPEYDTEAAKPSEGEAPIPPAEGGEAR